MNQLILFFYYLTAYSLGIVVLIQVVVQRSLKDNPLVREFFITTLLMTLTVLLNTLLNFLDLTQNTTLWKILTEINYLSAAVFSYTIIRLFHTIYPWKGSRIINGAVLVLTAGLSVLISLYMLFPILEFVPDLLLGLKNLAMLYTLILGMIHLRRKIENRFQLFTRILALTGVTSLPFFLITEVPYFKALSPVFRNVQLQGPWLLPGIYIVWCGVYLAVSARNRNRQSLPGCSIDEFTHIHKISPRELDVMKLLVLGKSYKEIMDNLNISMPTVKTHISSLYRKTGTANRLDLAVKAGLISPDHTKE